MKITQKIIEGFQGNGMWQCPSCRYNVFDNPDGVICNPCKMAADRRDRFHGEIHWCGCPVLGPPSPDCKIG